jgi:ectoine hydroxylase-related dioxygenase (phytanoyl-CoA dioxygenase family)
MGKVLSDSQVAQYETRGYVAPIPVLTRAQADRYRVQLGRFLEDNGGADPRAAVLRTKVHLRCPGLLELVSLPAIVDAVADVLGPDILCRSSSVFLKLPGDAAYVAWHQDAAYWELEPPDVATAWVALTDSTDENGALQVLPGSHRAPLMPHGELDDPANLLSRGQGITVPIDASRVISLVLRTGEMSIHHVGLAHGSRPNAASTQRMGFAIRYVAAHVRNTGRRRDSAMLVSGTDRFGHFDPERVEGPWPSSLERG